LVRPGRLFEGRDDSEEPAMSSGLEHQKQIHEALKEFEAAIVKREKRFFGNKVALQQDIDTIRDKLLKIIVNIALTERGQ
jgi:hypothetical protein